MTRIRKLTLVLVLGIAGSPLAPLPAGAVPPPAPLFLSGPVPGGGQSFTTAMVEAPGQFDLAGLAYDGPAGADVEMRASIDGAAFSPWSHLGDASEEGPDLGSPERQRRRATQPVWTGGARFVQYRVTSPAGPVGNLRVQAVDTAGHAESTLAKVGRHLRGLLGGAAPTRPAAAMTDQPAIVSRAQWGADERLRRDDPDYGEIEVAVVHHTVTANDYSASQADDLLRGIYAYHVNGNGWNDIGYNFLVDRFGTIYEGRYGGIERAVTGAHSAGFNARSFGAALLGEHGAVSPSAPAMAALQQLLAWKLDLAHVDPMGQTVVTSAGSNLWPEGAQVSLYNVSGHRDVGQTACPGELAYQQLAELRRGADQLGRPKFYAPHAEPETVTGAGGAYDPVQLRAVGTDPMAWGVTISHFALGEVRHLTAPASLELDLAWNGTDDLGQRLPGGFYDVNVSAQGPAGTARPGSFELEVDPADEPDPAERLAGEDRYATAAAAAQEVAAGTAANVVLASGDTAHLVDSLVAAPFAKAKAAPLLLSGLRDLPPATTAELDRLDPEHVWVIGGPAAVGDSVVAAVEAKGITVHRLSGPDAPSTAAEVARAMGGPRLGAIVVARDADHLVDGLAASGPGAGLGRPVLLVNKGSVPKVTSDTLLAMGSVDIWAVGGPAAIDDQVVVQLRARRIAGEDRWRTAAAVANAAREAGLTPDTFVLASGENGHLVDALSGGAFAEAVLLTAEDEMPVVTWQVLFGNRAAAGRVWVMGGEAAIDEEPAAEAQHAIN